MDGDPPPDPDGSSAGVTEVDVVIVGAGFSGLGMAIRLKQKTDRSFVILDAADDIGGTWRDNLYPGCACDVPSHLYSFSFAPNPDWSRMYSAREEIHAYLKGCVERFGLEPHLRLNTRVASARWRADLCRWEVSTEDGRVFRAPYAVLGPGGLRVPSIPELDGADEFDGPAMHSARWRDNVAIDGADVAVIGTGASSVQLIPHLAPRARKLTVFQRTAHWVLPKDDRAMRPLERKLFRWLPVLQLLLRWALYFRNESAVLLFSGNARYIALARWLGRWNIRRGIEDSELQRKVTPEFTPGCKRILLANDYYPALSRDNVDVVTEPIAALAPHAVVTADGTKHPADVIVYGTGFSIRDFLTPMKVYGLGGVELNELWERGGPEAYLGTMVAGFPNLFVLTGPNTGLGHNSIVFMIEAQAAFVLKVLRRAQRACAAVVEVTQQAQDRLNQDLQQRLAKTVWATGCKSWYLDDDGNNRTLWPGFTVAFWWRTRRVRWRDLSFSSPDGSERDVEPGPTPVPNSEPVTST